MLAVSDLGAVVAPPVPAFYARPESIDELVDHTVGRALDLFGLDTGKVRRWRDEGCKSGAVRVVGGRDEDGA